MSFASGNKVSKCGSSFFVSNYWHSAMAHVPPPHWQGVTAWHVMMAGVTSSVTTVWLCHVTDGTNTTTNIYRGWG